MGDDIFLLKLITGVAVAIGCLTIAWALPLDPRRPRDGGDQGRG